MLVVVSAFTKGEELQTPGAASFLASFELGPICHECVLVCHGCSASESQRDMLVCFHTCWNSPNSSKLAEICQVVPFSLIAGH